MELVIASLLTLVNLLGSAVTSTPTYVSMLQPPVPDVAQASDTATTPATTETPAVVAPTLDEDQAGTWSIAGEISISGDYSMPYRLEGYFKAHDAEPVLTKGSVGSEGHWVGFDVIPSAVRDKIDEYASYVLQAAAHFHLEGIGLRLCVDVLCLTAMVDADGTAFQHNWTTPAEPASPYPTP